MLNLIEGFPLRYLYPRLNCGVGVFRLPELECGKTIPKIIHQTYRSGSIPKALEDNIQKLKFNNPKWIVKLYRDEDVLAFIKSSYSSYVLRQFLRINENYGAARADLFRYLLMYKVGGVYLDIKSTLDKPLDEVLNAEDVFLLSTWQDEATPQYKEWGHHREIKGLPDGEFQQWHIVSAPGHPFLKAVIENVLQNINKYDPYLHGVGKTGVLNLTGPIAYSMAIAPLMHKNKYKLVKSKSDLGFVYTIFSSHEGHAAVFSQHYMTQLSPIIYSGYLRKAVFFIKNIVRKVLRRFFDIQ
jgi:mannosyltransferase OCH1-like enzyme